MSPSTHPAVVTVQPSAPLEILNVPTPAPTNNEVLVLVQWTASTPLDHHQASAHLLVNPPQILGDGFAGTVISVGPEARRYKPGDSVFGFTWRVAKEKAHQLFIVAPENLMGLVPSGRSMQESVVLGNNFVTVWHTFTSDFGFAFPWNGEGKKGKPDGYVPPREETALKDDSNKKKWILVWGGSSSCGMYGLQVLKYYGYENVIAVAGIKHHERLYRYGAKVCFDYRSGGKDVVEQVREFVKQDGGEIGYAFDCIGSLEGSLKPVSRIVDARGCKIAILLPVIVREGAEGVKPEYEMDVVKCANWAEGVEPVGVRTHFYTNNKVLADILQSEIMPWGLESGVIEPNDQVIVEAPTLLQRAQTALDMLRDKKVSGGRLVWRIAEPEQIEAGLASIQR